jgi:hypothetical protein
MGKRSRAADFAFESDEHHPTTVIFVTMIVALLLTTAAALDYARVANMREGIERAVKSASDAGVSALHGGDLPDSEIKTIVLTHFDKDAATARHVGTIDAPFVGVDRAEASVTVAAKGVVPMTISRLFGFKDVSVPASATTIGAPQSTGAPSGDENR